MRESRGLREIYVWLMSSHARLIFIMLIVKKSEKGNDEEEVGKMSSKSPKDAH